MCVRCVICWHARVVRTRCGSLMHARTTEYWVSRLMDSHELTDAPQAQKGADSAPKTPRRILLLVRHGQTRFNVEGRLPGQLPGVALTDEGRRQAYQVAVALSGLPLSAVISSPLERAHETARAIARGAGLEVRLDSRLMDTDVAYWAGRKIDDLKDDPDWKRFVERPAEPPAGVESLPAVQERALAVCEEIRQDASLGDYVALVAHADVVKLILAHYARMHVDIVRFLAIGNASISVLAFQGSEAPAVLAINWTPLPEWLLPPALRVDSTPPGAESHEEKAAQEARPAAAGESVPRS